MKDSDSDDELVAPDFLKKAQITTFPILTPRKAIQPSKETLSPLPVIDDDDDHEKIRKGRKSKISLLSLLTEKKKDDVIQQNVGNIMELKEKFKNDDYMELVSEDLDSTQNCSQISLSQDLEDSQDLSQYHCSGDEDHNSERNNQQGNKENMFAITKHFVNDFPDTFPGEKYFIQYRSTEDLNPVIRELFKYAMGCADSELVEEMGSEDKKILLYTILQSFIPLKGKLPSSTCKCLWQVLCCSQDYKISQTALQILTNYLLDKNSNSDWVPEADDIIEALKKCGAAFGILLPDSIAELMKKTLPTVQLQLMDSPISPRSVCKCFNSRLHNFRAVIKLLVISIQCHPKKYLLVDLNCLLIIAMRLTIEKVVQRTLCDIKILIGSLLDAYELNTWGDDMKNQWKMLSLFNMHHRNLLQLVETIPPSQRGTEFLQMLAFNYASSIIKKTDAFHALPIKISDTFNLISSIKITENTDYFELYSALSLLGMCVNTDDVSSGQKVNLIKLKDKLHMLHGEIKECKGAYLDRTKVKDVILRMVSKFKFVVQNLQSQSKMESYFDTSYKKIPVEILSSGIISGDEFTEDETQNVIQND